ncbi:zinc-dependent alcohol dehydrogenase family protein [Fortiea contorta]|uniref:zinc-dependent alcohol dehydrogenase family protein n=1 Tax=Fortiea contorta TaxID=1892405 RepID=UPI000348C906|nr:zinc-dependent alcohol dehydrogenase family protein [Fortiea contorta]
MKAVVFSQPETVVVEQVADPRCEPGEVIVQVKRAGICGTDLHILRNEYLSNFPLIPGHEFVGVVVEVGREVLDVKPGDRVVVDPDLYCGHCFYCRNQQANHCLNWQGIGVTRDGGFAEYVTVPVRACYKLPETISDAQATFIEPLACVIHGLNRLRTHPADEVLIFGAGPIGLLLLQALQNSGAAKIVVVEKHANRRALASQLGAVAIAADENQTAALRELVPYGFSIVVDATGVPAVIEQALNYLRPRGQYLQFGVAATNATITWRPHDIFRNDWTILGSYSQCLTFSAAIKWLENNKIDVESLVSHTFPLTEFPDALQRFARGETLKVHLQIS